MLSNCEHFFFGQAAESNAVSKRNHGSTQREASALIDLVSNAHRSVIRAV
jgi:hypothetical protein